MCNLFFSPLVQEKLELEKEAMDRIKQAQSDVSESNTERYYYFRSSVQACLSTLGNLFNFLWYMGLNSNVVLHVPKVYQTC